jgi:rRNA processing protein Krr1/Pno1
VLKIEDKAEMITGETGTEREAMKMKEGIDLKSESFFIRFDCFRRDESPDRSGRVRRSRFSNKHGESSPSRRYRDNETDDRRMKRSKWGDAPESKPGDDKGNKSGDVMASANPAISFNNAIGSARGDCSQLRRKLYLPQDGVNYIGLLIGPRGMFQKKLEGESGCKILIRGRGSQKEGQPPQPDDDDDQHVLIMGDTAESVELAVEACNKIILADEGTRNMIRKEQLKVAAELNNTIYYTSDNKATIDESMLTPYGPPSPNAYIVPVPNDCIGLIIGKKGETIRRLQLESGAKIQVAKREIESTGQRYVFVEGSEDKYNHAKELINEVVDEWKRVHQRPDIPLESKPAAGPSQTVPIPNDLIPYLTGERRDRIDLKCPDVIPVIYDKYNVKVYIHDTPDHNGNRNVEVSGEPEKVICAVDEIFNFLRERAGANLMMNPLYYASALGWNQYQDFAYPGEVPRNQAHTSQNYIYPQQNSYPPQYPPHGYQQPHPGGHSGPAYQPVSQDYAYYGSNPSANEYNREKPSTEENKEETAHAPRGDRNPKAHDYAMHYSKTLGGDYQYYYDYYMKSYANAPQPSGSGENQKVSSGK